MSINLDKELDPKLKAYLNKHIDQRIVEASRQVYDAVNKKIKAVETKINEVDLKATKNRAAIVASKGTLDMAYPPLLLATVHKPATAVLHIETEQHNIPVLHNILFSL
jgi:predicted DNA binding CopG/RHH family protein